MYLLRQDFVNQSLPDGDFRTVAVAGAVLTRRAIRLAAVSAPPPGRTHGRMSKHNIIELVLYTFKNLICFGLDTIPTRLSTFYKRIRFDLDDIPNPPFTAGT